jgi:nitroreductase
MTITRDPIAQIATAAIEHMNSEHADTVLAYARGLAGITWAKRALITRLAANGIEIHAIGDDRETTIFLPFEPPLTDTEQLRPVLIAMAQKARQLVSSEIWLESPLPIRSPELPQQLLNAIASRRSFALQELSSDPIDLEAVRLMLEAANWAPSHGQTEPWRFAVFSGDARHMLSEAFGTAFRLLNPDQPPGSSGEKSQRQRAWQAPVWIAIGMQPNPKRPEWEELIAVGCAVQNLHLIASALGLAGKWMSGGCAVHPHVAGAIGFAPETRLLGFFYVGRPVNHEWPRGRRRPLTEKVVWYSD